VNQFARILLRLITLVLALSLVIFLLVGSFYYIWRDAQGRAPQVGYTLTADKIERLVLGWYLGTKGDVVTQPANPNDAREITFVVESGEGVGSVANNLQRLGLVADAEIFRRVVQYEGADGDIQAGVYTLRPNMTMQEITSELQHGRLPSVAVTIPEGWRAEQIAEHLQELEIVSADEFMAAVARGRSDFDFLQSRPEGAPASLEGFLFPDTYQLPRQAGADRVIEIMLRNWDARLSDKARKLASEQDKTWYESVTLASIVEREAVQADERPMIAGVYLNRLEIGMYLQADPTVQYAKGYDPNTKRWWNPMLQEEANTIVSPYNTFQNPGLPPGPICNPGAAAILAALEPTASDYLYFYAKGDGSHVFAKTFEEHLQNEALFGKK